jgi:hypothetical protein
MSLQSRSILNLKVQNRVLTVQLDVDDLPWASPQSVRILSAVKAAVIQDFGKIISKEKGVLIVNGILAMEYEMATTSRKDHLLTGPKFERSEMFPYKLMLKVYPPNHVF